MPNCLAKPFVKVVFPVPKSPTNDIIVPLVIFFASFFARSWVFKKSSNQPLIKSFSLFCLIYILGGIEMSLVIMFLNDLTENYKIAWFFGALVGALNNYLGSKYLSFKK